MPTRNTAGTSIGGHYSDLRGPVQAARDLHRMNAVRKKSETHMMKKSRRSKGISGMDNPATMKTTEKIKKTRVVALKKGR
jgi:hypothetical protein